MIGKGVSPHDPLTYPYQSQLPIWRIVTQSLCQKLCPYHNFFLPLHLNINFYIIFLFFLYLFLSLLLPVCEQPTKPCPLPTTSTTSKPKNHHHHCHPQSPQIETPNQNQITTHNHHKSRQTQPIKTRCCVEPNPVTNAQQPNRTHSLATTTTTMATGQNQAKLHHKIPSFKLKPKPKSPIPNKIKQAIGKRDF